VQEIIISNAILYTFWIFLFLQGSYKCICYHKQTCSCNVPLRCMK